MKFIRKLSVGLLGLALSIITLTATAQAKEASLQLCLEAAADNSPVYPTQVFPAKTKEVARKAGVTSCICHLSRMLHERSMIAVRH